jgi:hypothetical protein
MTEVQLLDFVVPFLTYPNLTGLSRPFSLLFHPLNTSSHDEVLKERFSKERIELERGKKRRR